MKIVAQQSLQITGLSPMEHIEKIGRICYKSEDKIADGTAAKFVAKLFASKHHAMLEHYRFIMQVSPAIYEPISDINLRHFEYTFDNDRYLISCSARSLINMVEDSHCEDYGYLPMAISGIRDELIGHICKAYGCYELFGKTWSDQVILSTSVKFIPNSPEFMSKKEWNRHGWKSVHFITDRGISHEIVRHREETSFAQESTRYCCYGDEITVIDQGFQDLRWVVWESAMRDAEQAYLELLRYDVKPQMARSVLPTCLKTEIVVTAPVYEWNHILNLRFYGTTGAPHPMIKELMRPIAEEGWVSYEKDYCDNN